MSAPPANGGGRPRVLVAFSGGLDSTVLLHAAALLLGPQALLALHVNHRLQPAAAAFERQARATCQAWGVPLVVRRLGGQPGRGQSIEAWAREQRYRLMAREAVRHGITELFTGHHRDDQLETLLIALSRGAGLHGLAGIAEQRVLEGLTLHRPLLACSRAQIQAHARLHGLQWIEDPSNQDERFLRNRLRHRVLPLLEEAVPGFGQQALTSMAHLADAAFGKPAPTGPGAPHRPAEPAGARPAEAASGQIPALSRGRLRDLDERDTRNLLRAWLQQQGLRPPHARQLEDWLGQLRRRTGRPLRLAGQGWMLRARGEQLWIEPLPAGPQAQPLPSQGLPLPSQALPVAAAGRLQPTARGWRWPLPAFAGQLLIEPRGPRPPAGFPVPDALHIARPASRDRLCVSADRPRRSLKNLFQESGIEAGLRTSLPAVWQGDRLLHVPGLGTDPASPWTFHFLPDL